MEAEDNNMSLRVASFSCYLDTAKESLVRRVSSQDHTPIPSTMKPPINIKFSKKDHTQQEHAGLTNLRVDSFNSYLNTGSDHNFVFEVPGPIQDPTSAFTFSQEVPKDGEIGVFGADKYFNMKLEYQTGTKTAYKNEANLAPMGKNVMPRTPSLSSEATSWNSQRALLPNQQGNESQMKQKKAMARRLFMGFGCRGPCFDKKSVYIDEIVAREGFYTSKPSRTGSERLDHHLEQAPPPPPPPPKLGDHHHQDLAAVETKKMMKVDDFDESRPSIEVFGSLGRSEKGDAVAKNMERKLSMLTWDAIPKGRNLPTSRDGTSTVCDDMASEASSDLFEIENISGSIFPLLADDDIDMSGCMSPTTSLYAPSEASIQWSVVTASAADYSALSEFNDESVSVAGNAVSKKIVARRGKEVPKVNKAGGFLGCKSHKAVDVAENVCVKSNEMMKAKNTIQGQLQ